MQRILALMAIPRTASDGLGQYTAPAMIANFLSVSIGRVFLILEQLRSVINWAAADQPIKFWHASISGFLLDEARSKEYFVDIRIAHEVLARGYLRLIRSQLPDLFLEPYSNLFATFVEHYKRALFSERLQHDLVGYDFFSAYKAAIKPLTLRELGKAWKSQRVQELFRMLVCPSILVNSLSHNIHPIFL